MSENILSLYQNCAGSDFRELLLKRAKDAFTNNEIENSMFYQIKSLCSGFDCRYSDQIEEEEFWWSKNNLKAVPLSYESPLVKYAIEYLGSKRKSKKPNSNSQWKFKESVDPEEGLRQVQEICMSMPEEWTVLQLCKEQREDTTYSTFREIIAADAPIYLSILKHPRSKEYPNPICLRLTSDNQVQLFEKFSTLTSLFSEYAIIPPGPVSTEFLEKYWAGIAILEKNVANAIAELKTFMGPWVGLLCGNVKSDKKFQENIFSIVDTFCDTHEIEPQRRVLLSLLAQQRHILTEEHIEQATLSLTANEHKEGDVKESTTYQAIYTFLKELQSKEGVTFGPCILIIDERIDHFYWEVLNPWQEICRISSFHILVRLFERYKSRIKNGYLMVNVEKGRCLVNPDCNLPEMEKRMNSFFNYWLPNWNCTYGVVPTKEDYIKFFEEADCYIYCGHGSGLQYLNGRKISKFQMECIVFLFGCDSVRLRSQGLHSEMIGSHLYYHAALCPAVVGTLQLGFDFQVDKIATTLLSKWIPPSCDKIIHWNFIDKSLWKKGSITTSEKKNFNLPNQYEGSLARAICAIHRMTKEKLYNTVGFVYRGLPVWNSSNSHL